MITITVDDGGFVAELDRLTAQLRQPTALAALLQRELRDRLGSASAPAGERVSGGSAQNSFRPRASRKPGSALARAAQVLAHHGSPLRLEPVLPKGGKRRVGNGGPQVTNLPNRAALTRVLVQRAEQYLSQLIA